MSSWHFRDVSNVVCGPAEDAERTKHTICHESLDLKEQASGLFRLDLNPTGLETRLFNANRSSRELENDDKQHAMQRFMGQ